MVYKNTDNGTSQSWQKGNLVEGQTLLLSFFFGDMCKSSRDGATEHQNQQSPGFPPVGTATHQSGGDYWGQSLNLRLCSKCTYHLCICPFIPPFHPLPPRFSHPKQWNDAPSCNPTQSCLLSNVASTAATNSQLIVMFCHLTATT